MATYGLWRSESPLNVAPFSTEGEALAAVRAAVEQHGEDFVVGWSLVRIPGKGDWVTLAEGQALVERAVSQVAHQNERTQGASAPRAASA